MQSLRGQELTGGPQMNLQPIRKSQSLPLGDNHSWDVTPPGCLSFPDTNCFPDMNRLNINCVSEGRTRKCGVWFVKRIQHPFSLWENSKSCWDITRSRGPREEDAPMRAVQGMTAWKQLLAWLSSAQDPLPNRCVLGVPTKCQDIFTCTISFNPCEGRCYYPILQI